MFFHHVRRLCVSLSAVVAVAALLIVLAGCRSSQPYATGPIKTVDPDREAIPQPREIDQNFYWDRVDLTLFHQVKKPLDLGWTARRIGSLVGATQQYGPAENVNVLDEPPRSSWWEPRDYYRPMSPQELAAGPNVNGTVDAGPDTSGVWTIWRGKSVGAASGFFIEDAQGDRYLLKFDSPKYPELASSAEVISTKILHASGYHVPQNTVAYVHPDQIEIGEDATVQDGNSRRPMRSADVASVLEGQPRRADGTIRVMASRFVDGQVLGPWNFRGRRDDDPNDRVRHQDRRELRGLRVISAWLNDTDRRAANTLAVYTDDRYVKHYVQDMSSTLGANTGGPHLPIHGQAYMIDHRKIVTALASLGAYPFPWWDYDPSAAYPSVGYWRSDVFKPGDWVPTYPNPAFEKLTDRDAFWGAKIVSAFSDEDLDAIVETAEMSNPEAEAYLLTILRERRDKTARYWFSRLAPLDHFRVEASTDGPRASAGNTALRESAASGTEEAENTGAPLFLRFEDLSIPFVLVKRVEYQYETRHVATGRMIDRGQVIGRGQATGRARSSRASGGHEAIPLQVETAEKAVPIGAWLNENAGPDAEDRVVRVRITPVYMPSSSSAFRAEGEHPPVDVYVMVPTEAKVPDEPPEAYQREAAGPGVARVIGIRR